MTSIKFGKIEIGNGSPTFIISEAGVNHNGDIETAKKLIDAAKEAGADAVKFQTFTPSNLVTSSAPRAEYQIRNIGGEESQFQMLQKLALPYTDFQILKDYCDHKEILFLSTPHTPDAVDYLNNLLPCFKIGSGDLTNIPLLSQVAKTMKPIILGTGMATLDEVREALKAIHNEGNKSVVMLHCTTNYPCPGEEVNLMAMRTMIDDLDCLVGYSDHTQSTMLPSLAVSIGAVCIEKHFTLDKSLPGPDHKASLNPQELKEMIEQVRFTEKVMGSKVKCPTVSEEKIKMNTRKSIVANCNISKGQKVHSDMICVKRPGTGVLPKYYDRVVQHFAARDIQKDEVISWDMLRSSYEG